MKIKTRKERMLAYNEKYANRVYQPTKDLIDYFSENGLDIKKASNKAKKKLLNILDHREYETISITMYEYPMKTDRPRSTMMGRTYSPNAAENHSYFERAIKKVGNAIKLINTPAEIVIDAYLEMPARVPPDEIILFEAKVLDVEDTPDYDNIGKCYTDIQKYVLILDDDIFHTGTINKFYSVKPRVEIRITYLKNHESEYIYKKLKARKSVKELIASGQLELHKIDD